jgi:hypothetical protein
MAASNLDPNKKYPVIEHYPRPQIGSVGQWMWRSGGENKALPSWFVVVQLDHLARPTGRRRSSNYTATSSTTVCRTTWRASQLGVRFPFRTSIASASTVTQEAASHRPMRFCAPEFYKVAYPCGQPRQRSYNIYWAEKYQVS